MIISVKKSVMLCNKPDSGRGPLVDLQGVQPHLHCLEQGQQFVVALASHAMTTIVPQCP